jgi:CRP-like cAMP-binding protein
VPLVDQTRLRNSLLRRMRPEDFALLAPDLVAQELPKDLVLVAPNEPFESAHFVERGLGSIVAISPDGQMVESGIFGRDGFGPVGLVMGAGRSPYRSLVQIAGEGYRLPAKALREAMEASAPLRDLLLRYAHALSVQTSYTALSNAVHPIDERLARWLLMCHDRVSGDEIALTHEFLSIMLAVRRPSVTTALHVLEGNRFVRAERGVITVIDRRALEEFAGDAYGRPEAEYERLIGPLR